MKQEIIDNEQLINADCYTEKGMASTLISQCKHLFFCHEILMITKIIMRKNCTS